MLIFWGVCFLLNIMQSPKVKSFSHSQSVHVTRVFQNQWFSIVYKWDLKQPEFSFCKCISCCISPTSEIQKMNLVSFMFVHLRVNQPKISWLLLTKKRITLPTPGLGLTFVFFLINSHLTPHLVTVFCGCDQQPFNLGRASHFPRKFFNRNVNKKLPNRKTIVKSQPPSILTSFSRVCHNWSGQTEIFHQPRITEINWNKGPISLPLRYLLGEIGCCLQFWQVPRVAKPPWTFPIYFFAPEEKSSAVEPSDMGWGN